MILTEAFPDVTKPATTYDGLSPRLVHTRGGTISVVVISGPPTAMWSDPLQNTSQRQDKPGTE
jgi:hypothetical protein